MGNVVPQSASPERIVEDFRATLVNARQRGGRARQLAEARLGPLEPMVSETEQRVAQATATAEQDERELLARDSESDVEIAAVLDEIESALDHDVHAPDFALIAGTGKAQWADSDPRKQHHLMAALEQNIRASAAAPLQGQKVAWAQRLRAKAVVHAAAADLATRSQISLEVQHLIFRGLANVVQASLGHLKCDYKSEGLTEEQIHEIIPDYVRRARRGRTSSRTDLR